MINQNTISECRIYDEKYRCWDTEPLMVYPNQPIVKQGRVIQWWTGLFDNNKKKIYEGDIVQTIYPHDPYHNIGVVIFHNETCGFRIKTQKQLLPIVTFRYVENKPEGLIQVADKVVGNIFELPCNPDHNGECLVCDNWPAQCEFLNP